MISIIIPVYNSERYLKQCMDSIISQIFKDFEIVLVDDGSNDNSLNIIKQYAANYKNIRYFTQVNSGVSVARNLALKKSKGEFIVFVDSDDYLEESYLQELYKNINNNSSDIAICGLNKIYDDDIKGNKEEILPESDGKSIPGKEAAEKVLEYKIDGYVCNKIFRRKNLIKNDFKFESGRVIEDFFPIFNEILLSSKVSFVSKALYNYRQRGNSELHNIDMKRLEDYKFATKNIIDLSIKMNLNKNSISYFHAICFCVVIDDYYNNFKYLENDFYKQLNNNFYDYRIKFKELLFNKIISRKIKLKIITWNLKIYRYLKLINEKVKGIK